MNGAFFEIAAKHVRYMFDRNERFRIDFLHDRFQLGQLETGHDAVDHLRIFPGITAARVDERRGASQLILDRLGNLLVFAGNDRHRLGFVEAFDHDIHHFGSHIIRKDRIHRGIPAEYETA